MTYSIPFNRPFFAGNEQEYIAESIAKGQISGNGYFTRACEGLLEQWIEARRVMLTTSCTDALEMCALLLELEPDDEVIIPSFTFVSTANAFAMHGARIVFADIRPDTLNLSAEDVAAKISSRTRAVVPVHYGGIGCEMGAILEIAGQHDVTVIEDNAHGLLGRHAGKPLGSFGALATQSFHETKNFSCGEGGALVVNDEALVVRAEILRDKGTDRAGFMRGEVDKYSWVDVGSSFLPSDLLAAFLYGQLEQHEFIQAHRRGVWLTYRDGLSEWAEANGVRMPVVPDDCEPSYHLFQLLLPSEIDRDGLIEHLKEHDILAVFHYQPLHLSKMGRRYGGVAGDHPVTEDVSARLVRLPFYNSLTDADQQRVIEVVCQFRPSGSPG